MRAAVLNSAGNTRIGHVSDPRMIASIGPFVTSDRTGVSQSRTQSDSECELRRRNHVTGFIK
jgi:hypothetical protein